MPDKEVFEYQAPWPIYSLDWSLRSDQPFRLAVGSFIEEYCNKVRVIKLNQQTEKLEEVLSFSHPYPTTKVQWFPSRSTKCPDLLATSGDYLRLWEIRENNTAKMKCMFTANKRTEFCAPITSFDWCEKDPNILGAASIDTTCTIWDVATETLRTQLIAHDKDVFDMAFSPTDSNRFASVGADGSMRTFDLRSLEHSTVMYESDRLKPLLRVSWNKMDENYLALLPIDSTNVIVIDTRYPSMPAAELSGHNSVANGVTWAPHSSCHLCTAGDDWQALIWDLQALPDPIEEPILAYTAEGEVNNLRWSALQTDWVAINFADKLQTLRV